MGLAEKGAQTCTLVVPCYNEAGCIPTLIDRIQVALSGVPNFSYEILFVNDGSTDGTALVLARIRLQNPRVAVVTLARNFGHQGALLAGLQYAQGDAIIVMDADLQHPPELLPEFVSLWRQGFDVVQGVRQGQPGLRKSLASRSFYFLINRISEVEIQDGAADFRLMSRSAVNALLALPEQTRFVRGIVAWLGFRSTLVPFRASARHAGEPGYTFRASAKLARDALVTLSTRPLDLALYMAALTLLAGSGYFVYVAWKVVSGEPLVRGWTSTILTVLLLGSANLFCTGILGMYLREVLTSTRKRPPYVVASVLASQTGSPSTPDTEPIKS